MFAPFSPSAIRSWPQRLIRSLAGRTSMTSWSTTFARSSGRSTSWTSSPSPGHWCGSTKSVRSSRSWWVPTHLTCLSTLSASWTTSMFPVNLTGELQSYCKNLEDKACFGKAKTKIIDEVWEPLCYLGCLWCCCFILKSENNYLLCL